MIKKILLTYMAITGISLLSQAQSTLLVGTYTNGKSQGIYVYDFASNTGEATLRDSVRTSNPSFLAVAPNNRYIYAVNEDGSDKGGGKISAYTYSKSKKKLSFV